MALTVFQSKFQPQEGMGADQLLSILDRVVNSPRLILNSELWPYVSDKKGVHGLGRMYERSINICDEVTLPACLQFDGGDLQAY